MVQDFERFLADIPIVNTNSFWYQKTSCVVHDSLGQVIKLKVFDQPFLDFSGLARLTELTHLNIIRCNLRAIPASLGKLQRIESLDFAENQISTIKGLDNLTTLKSLGLNDNQISLIEGLSNLPELHSLGLNNNQISVIQGLENQGRLYGLGLADNNIRTITMDVDKLTNLGSLHVTGNPIAKHMAEMTGQQGGLWQLKSLDSFSSLKGLALLRYLKKAQTPTAQPLNEAKLLVVGDERVGKTSLINRLQGKPLNPDETSTRGIDITQLPLPGSDIKLNIWDFAGQEITHQTHQFFLSARSVYLLVLDAQKEDDEVGILRWLKDIKANGDNPPIIVALNKFDKNDSCRFDRNRYAQHFNIVDVLCLSAADTADIDPAVQIPHGINDLVNSISRQVNQLEDTHLPMQPDWLAVKDELEAMKHASQDYIEASQYSDLCRANNIQDEDTQSLLLRIFSQIGTIVTFENTLLCNRQIINPQWVTEGVYKVVRKPNRSDAQANSNATLNEAEFKQLFAGDPRFHQPYHYSWLISLLQQFQLAFNLDDGRTLIPLRLDSQQPALDWSTYHQGSSFRFSYPDLLKKSVIARFIVNLHQNIDHRQQPPYWQRGVFLRLGSARALVVSDEDARTITIGVDKSNRDGDELLSVIRHTIRAINGKNGRAAEQVPLFYDGVLAGFADYDDLLEAEKEGDDVMRLPIAHADKKTHKFKLADLLQHYRINQDPRFDLDKLGNDLIAIAQLEQETAHSLAGYNEDQINDQFRKALTHKDYRVADQSRGGISESGKSVGERDLVVRNRDTGVVESILEGMVLTSFGKDNIDKHYNKLNYRYDTAGNRRNFMLLYVRSARFDRLWQQYLDHIEGIEDVTGDFTDKSKLKVGRSRLLAAEVYHIFVDLFVGA